jgi:hypothetical protein
VETYNATHRDKVHFAGVEYYSTPHLAYDAIEAYVARHAPYRLAELKNHFKLIRPHLADMGEYVGWYANKVTD